MIGRVVDYLAREPVALGAAVLGTCQAFDLPNATMVAIGLWVAWAQRLASKSKITANEEADGARWAGAVEEAARQASPPPKRRRA